MGASGYEAPAADPIAVLCLDGDDEYRTRLTRGLNEVTDIHALGVESATSALGRLSEIDCLLCALELPETDGLDVLSVVRERKANLPFVLHTAAPLAAVADRLFEADHTDYVRKDADDPSVRLLARRIRSLVDRRRSAESAHRLAVAVDACRTPTLVVDSCGTIEYANGQFSSTVLPAREDLRGRPWTDLFTEEAVERFRREAITVGTEGWTWTGTTSLSGEDGTPIEARADLVHLEDGSKVFVFRDLAAPITAEA